LRLIELFRVDKSPAVEIITVIKAGFPTRTMRFLSGTGKHLGDLPIGGRSPTAQLRTRSSVPISMG
jgi:hypothetical protein